LKKATLYVSLEPCNHFGKTPPCSDLIIKSGIKKVVVGCIDSHDKVAGAGIEKLRKSGCEVLVGVLENECIEANKRFFVFHTKKRPYVTLKWAQTNNGFIDKVRAENDKIQPNWITNKHSQQLVHKWRAEENAILVGTNTVLNDNPKLNVRDWFGDNPIRIILDRSLRIPKKYHIYSGTTETIILTEKKVESHKNIIFEQLDFSENVAQQICAILYRYNIQSLFVEGGKQTLETFINANLWDEARIFIGTVSFSEGLSAPKLKGKVISETKIKEDNLKILKNSSI